MMAIKDRMKFFIILAFLKTPAMFYNETNIKKVAIRTGIVPFMINKLEDFLQRRFLRDVASMFAGNIFAQAISFLAAIVITRLYTPVAFGVMSYIWSLTSIFAIVTSLGYQHAIILPLEEKKAEALMRLSLLCTLGITCIITLGFWSFKGVLASRAGIPGVEYYLWFVPLGILVFGIRQILISVHTRFKHFTLISGSQVVVAAVTALSKIIPALLIGASALWLVAGNVIGPLVSSVPLVWVYSKYRKKQERFAINDSDWTIAREYIKIPKYHLPTELLNTLSQNLPVILFAAFFSPEVVGFYGLANNILRKPADLFSQSLNRVFLQKAVETDHSGGNQFILLKRTTTVMFLIGIVPLGILTIFGDKIFVLIFGQQWQTAGQCGQILAPWMFIIFLNITANQIIFAKQAFKFKFLLELAYILLSFVGIYLGHYFFPDDFRKTLAIFSFIGCSRGLVLSYVAFMFSRKL